MATVPPGAAPLHVAGHVLIDWGGALRWLRTGASAAERVGGHATLFRGGARTGEVFHPPTPTVRALHGWIKAVFEPAGIVNPERIYEGI